MQSVLQVECGSQLQAKSIILFLANAHYKVKLKGKRSKLQLGKEMIGNDSTSLYDLGVDESASGTKVSQSIGVLQQHQ